MEGIFYCRLLLREKYSFTRSNLNLPFFRSYLPADPDWKRGKSRKFSKNMDVEGKAGLAGHNEGNTVPEHPIRIYLVTDR
jgi:hypothetical protein